MDGFSRALGPSSALLTTKGTTSDEGYYSDPVRVEPGQTVELLGLARGGRGGEEMLVGMWLYTRQHFETPVGNLNFSVTLSEPSGGVRGHRSHSAGRGPLRSRSRPDASRTRRG